MAEHKKAPNQVKEQQGHYDIPERFEILNGVRYDFLASPKVQHQQVVGELFNQFYNSCRERGVILVAPMDVHFDEKDNIAQPDLIFIANENRAIIRDGFVFGAPDLLVEVLSESTGRRDKTVKRAMYERFGVKEYWVADPVYRTVDQLLLVNGTYQWHGTFIEGDILTSPQFECIRIDVSTVFPAE